jgi:hypothetical protein
VISEDTANRFRSRLWTGRVVGAFVTLAFLGSAASKLAHLATVVGGLTRAGIPEGAIVPIALLELSCLALYLFRKTSVLGTFLLTGYIGGAIVTHIIGRQSLLPPLIVGLLMFTSAYLRHRELWDLVPFQRSVRNTAKVPRRLIQSRSNPAEARSE